MKFTPLIRKKLCPRGLTLIELTVVIVMLFALVGASFYGVSGYRDWQRRSEAIQELRKVYNAQRTYLSEHPTQEVSTITEAQIIPYLSDKSAALPIFEGLDGESLSVRVDVSPPQIVFAGTQNVYPPTSSGEDPWVIE